MMPTTERAEAITRAQRAVKLLNEHEAPTRRDLGEARDRFNGCYNLPTGEHVWDAVDQLEATAAKSYGVPDIDQARLEGATAHTDATGALVEPPPLSRSSADRRVSRGEP